MEEEGSLWRRSVVGWMEGVGCLVKLCSRSVSIRHTESGAFFCRILILWRFGAEAPLCFKAAKRARGKTLYMSGFVWFSFGFLKITICAA